MANIRHAAVSFLVLVSGCSSVAGDVASVGRRSGAVAIEARPEPPPLFRGMGRHRRKVSTSSALAQSYFDQALTWTYAFNHDEAIRSYEEAARLDPTLAMAWWGVALCHGPHINNAAMTPESSAAAWAALSRAKALLEHASPVERDLIDALSSRYADPPPVNRRPLDEAYAGAMRALAAKHPQDADVVTLHAEAVMDLRPWDLWSPAGEPRPETPEVLEALEKAMRLDPRHPGAHHLYIHAVEASLEPERGDAAATLLRRLVPASGHLVHMPSHIDIRRGRWRLAAEANERAIDVDRDYRSISPKQGFYNIYMAHDHQFLSFVAMMQGRERLAIDQARAMVAGIPSDFVDAMTEAADPFFALPYAALVRFGRWEEMLGEPPPDPRLLVTAALRLEARAVALAALDRVAEAEREHEAFRAAVALVPEGRVAMNNGARTLLSVADHVIAGEIAFAKGELEAAARHLRAAGAIEEQLVYNEPPDWVIPTRHALGAVLLAADLPNEAEAAHVEDLRRWPENLWSLHGLHEALRRQPGRESDAKDVARRLAKARAQATYRVSASCACAAGR